MSEESDRPVFESKRQKRLAQLGQIVVAMEERTAELQNSDEVWTTLNKERAEVVESIRFLNQQLRSRE